MKKLKWFMLPLLAVLMVNPGCSCPSSPQPININLTNGNPQATGAKVKCGCTLTYSAAALSAMPNLTQNQVVPVEACLTVDYTGNEEGFCEQVVTPYEQILLEEAALFTAGGGGLGQKTSTPTPVICGQPYYGMQEPKFVAVGCTDIAFSGPSGTTPSLPETNCLSVNEPFDPDASLNPVPDAGSGPNECAMIQCNATTDPSQVPTPDNCLVQGENVVPESCKCTVPIAQGCTPTTTDRPLCTVPPGSGDPVPLTTSPMTWVASRFKDATIDHSHSNAAINVNVPICASVFGVNVCPDNATGSADPGVSGDLDLFGGPCPGSTCNITLDALVYVDDFTLNTTDESGLFGESDTVSGTRIKLTLPPDDVITVNPDGTATIPIGELSYDAVAVHNGQAVEQTGTNDNPVPLTINWASGQITISNLVEPIEQSSGTLNLVGNFSPSIVETFEQNIPAYDTDGDGVPDRLDNCPTVPNPTQVPVPPQFGAVSTLSLTACNAGGSVTIPTPPVTDPCFKPVTITGAAIGLNGGPITPIPIQSSTPITVQPPFNSAGMAQAAVPIPNGTVALPSGAVVIQWTAVDSNGATAVIAQTIDASVVPTLYASGTLSVDDGTIVSSAGGRFGTIANKGTGTTHVGVSAQVGDILSVGPVFLANNAIVNGFLETGGALTTQAGASINGATTQNDSSILFAQAPVVTAVFPTPTPAPVDLEPNKSGSIVAGAYGAVSVKENATLTLGSGSYTFASLDLEPQSKVIIDSANGSVVVDVQQSIIFNGGSITDTGNPQAPDFLLAYTGTQAVNVAVPYNGAIFAPNASLTLDTVSPGFTGQFFAQELEIGPHTTVTHRAYHCGQ